MMATSPISMGKRVLLSALVGVAAGAFPIDPVNLALYQRYVIHNDVWFAMGLVEAIEISLGRAPWVALFGLLLASPLIAIAVATGVVFRKSIDRHPLLWASVAPVLVWLFTCAVFALPDDSQAWMPHRGFPQRMLGTLGGIDNSLFFFAPAAAAVAFVLLTRRAAKRAG